MKKKILGIIFCMLLSCLGLVGCGNNPTKTYEAYKEFYREFYDKHMDKGADHAYADCGAQILFDEKNNPLMVISDCYMSSDQGVLDVYVYEYKGGKVNEVTRKTDLTPTDDGMYIESVDGKIALYVPEFDSSKGTTIYVLNEDGFNKEISVGIETDSEEEALKQQELEANNIYVDYWNKGAETSPLYVSLFWETSEVSSLSGSNFETLLTQLAEKKPSTNLELKMAYNEFFKSEGIYDETCFRFVEDGMVYYYSSAENKLYYSGKLGVPAVEDTTKDVPEKINDIEVELSSRFVALLLDEIEIADISEFEYNGNEVSVLIKNDINITLPTSIVEEEYDGETELHETVWNVRIMSSDTLKESSAEAVKKYIDAGLATEIYFKFKKVYVSGCSEYFLYEVVLRVADDEAYTSIMSEEEKQKYMVEQVVIPAYEEYAGQQGTSVVRLFYLNDDVIPEMIIQPNGAKTSILCTYANGQIVTKNIYNSNSFFEYQNLLLNCGQVIKGITEDTIISIQDNELVEVVSGQRNYNDNLRYLAGQQVSIDEYNEVIDYTNAISMYSGDFYSTVREAYENVRRFIFRSDIDCITKFEMTDNVLTFDYYDEDSFSYPVATNCAWEETSYGEVYGTYTYDTLKAEIESERNRYLANPEGYESPVTLIIEIKDGEIIRIYTVSA